MNLTKIIFTILILVFGHFYSNAQLQPSYHSSNDNDDTIVVVNNINISGGATVIDINNDQINTKKDSTYSTVKAEVSKNKMIETKKKELKTNIKYSKVVSHHYNPSKNPFTFSASSQLSSVFISSAPFKLDFNSVQSKEILLKDIHKYTKLNRILCI